MQELTANMKTNKNKQETIIRDITLDIVFQGEYNKAKRDYRNAKIAEQRNKDIWSKAVKEHPDNFDEIRENYVQTWAQIKQEKERAGKLIIHYKNAAETNHKGVLEFTEKNIRKISNQLLSKPTRFTEKIINKRR